MFFCSNTNTLLMNNNKVGVVKTVGEANIIFLKNNSGTKHIICIGRKRKYSQENKSQKQILR